MKNRYEALLVLDTKGKEEGAKEIIERLEKELANEGAAVEQVQRMEKKPFSYVQGHLTEGYFSNFIFEAEPTIIDTLQAKFKLDADIYRYHFQKLPAKKTAKKA